MAKITVTGYPKDKSRVQYKTTKVTETPKRTRGHVYHGLPMSRYYYKPSMNQAIFRTRGVMRRSAVVKAINDFFSGRWKNSTSAPAVQCAGLPWGEFVGCLRNQFKQAHQQRPDQAKAEATSMNVSNYLSQY